MDSVKLLFEYDLSCALEAERAILEVINKLASETNDEEIGHQLKLHSQETEQQIQNLERCIEILEMEPQTSTPHLIKAMEKERESFVALGPTPEILTAHDLDATLKTEHLEMAMYLGLIEKAKLMNNEEVVNLLGQNLQQEEAMADQVEQLIPGFGENLMEQA